MAPTLISSCYSSEALCTHRYFYHISRQLIALILAVGIISPNFSVFAAALISNKTLPPTGSSVLFTGKAASADSSASAGGDNSKKTADQERTVSFSSAGKEMAIQDNNPEPNIISLSPDRTIIGVSAFTLTVNGSGFVNDSVVLWNDVARVTNFVSATQLTVEVQESDVAATGAASIKVFNPPPGGGTSNAVNFFINSGRILLKPAPATRNSSTNEILVTLAITNKQVFDADVHLTRATLRNLATGVTVDGTPVPQSTGVMGIGSTSNVTLSFPGSVGGPGAQVLLSVSGSFTGGPAGGGDFSGGFQLKAPALSSRIYTTNADFGEGSLINVGTSVPDQLQLNETTQAFNFIWVAVSSKGTIVKINTDTGAVLGEYRTAPQGQPTNPSRTTVDLNGNVWNTNRDGNSVIHVGLVENDQCVDRNRNGVIDTSTGLNDIRPWTNAGGADTNGGVSTAADECILHYTRVRSSGTRHVSVTAENDVWVSGTGSRQFDLIDGTTGQIKRMEPSVGFGGYGGLIDLNGVIWSARPLLRWDTSRPLTGPNGVNWRGYSHDSYGLCIDSNGNVWNTELGGRIRKFAPDGTQIGIFNHGAGRAQGCVVDRNDEVWVAHSADVSNTVGHLKNNGTFVGNVTVGTGPTGVAVDRAGKIWSTNYNSRNVSRIDPNIGPIGADGVTRVGAVDFTSVDLGGNLYNYSDMTGSTLGGRPNNGTWSVIFDSQIAGAEWGRIGWSERVCGDGALTVTATSSNDGVTFGNPQPVTRGGELAVANGRYLRISVSFRRASTGESPVLYDLSVSTEGFEPPSQVNTAPSVNAGADQLIAPPNPARLKGSVCDDGLPLGGAVAVSWSKVSGPGTVTFANANAIVTTATFSVEGTYVLRLTASDSQFSDSDVITITVENNNRPPVITSEPVTVAYTGRPYTYQVAAYDPNAGDTITYSFPTAPTGMTINAATGLIQWTPTAAQVGNHNVRLVVTDTAGAEAEQTYTVSVTVAPPNRPPTITSTAPTSAVVGATYTYAVVAVDPDPNEALNYSLDAAPAGMTINSTTGLVRWTPTAQQLGTHNVTIRVRDLFGLSVTQSFSITVGGPDNIPPTVNIAGPDAGVTLTSDTTVTGTVMDDNLQSWTLEYQVSGGETWIKIASGTGPVNNGTLGTFPASLVANNPYKLRLRASDFSQESETFREIQVDSGALKLGAFTLSYEDLRLPSIGMPIVIRRFYDTKRAEPGDFGPGWTLGFSGVDIRTDESFNVFVTLPNGRRVAFAFRPVRLPGIFPAYRSNYVPAPGVYDKLENNECGVLFPTGNTWACDLLDVYDPQTYTLRTKEGLIFTLTASGGIRRIEDRNGRFIEITANGVTSNYGKNVTFTRNAEGRITSIKDPANNIINYEYDAKRRLSRFRDPLGNVTSYAYQGNSHLITEVQTPGGCKPLKTEYGPDGRVTAKVDNAGDRSTYSYNLIDRSESVTNPLGDTVVYKYDERGNLLEVSDQLGKKTTYTYDANNNNLSVTLPSGRRIERTFDNLGNPLTQSESPGPGTILSTTFAYNALSLITGVTRPRGDKTTFQYDDKGNLTRRELRDSENNVAKIDSFTYDGRGNQLTWTDGEGKTTQYTYNAFGELINQRDPSGVTIAFEYGVNGYPSAQMNGAGNRTEFEYNGFNLLTKVKQEGVVISSATYNELGKPLTATDALGRTTTFNYDCQGNLIKVIDPAGKETHYEVNALGSLTKVRDAKGHETVYLYDAANRQTGRTGPDDETWSTSFDDDSNIQSVSTPNGVTTQMQYDGMGRMVREIRPEKTTEFTYADCCLQSQVDEKVGSSIRTTKYSYDGVGRPLSVTDPQNRTIAYTYNGRGQRASMTTPDGIATSYAYDDAGRLAEIRTGTDNVRFTYDAAGRRSQTLYSNGAKSAYSYNNRGQLSSLTILNAANAVIASYAYALDQSGNRTGVTYNDGTAAYSYDALKRLTGENVASESLGNYNKTFSYDDVGNRLDLGATFSPDNRLLRDNGGDYLYDNNGNLITRGAKRFGYDSANRLINFTNDNVSAAYQYDYLGRRTLKTVNGTTREFLYDGSNFAAEYIEGAQVARYTYGLGVDEALMVTRNGQTYFYHADGLGSIVAITNNAGQVVQRYGYDAFGNIRLNSGLFTFSGSGLVNTVTFTGREYDDESGLYYYRARSYDPVIGRFIQKDPHQGFLALPQTQNAYPYVLNNPANNIDPSGAIVLLGYITVLDSKTNENAAALIGGVFGYAISHLIFLSEFLGTDSSLSFEDQWDKALDATKKQLKKPPFSLPSTGSEDLDSEILERACLSASIGAEVPIPYPSVVKGFYDGSELGSIDILTVSAGATISYSATYYGARFAGPYAEFFFREVTGTFSASGKVIDGSASLNIGGIKCGAALGVTRLKDLQPK